MKTKLIRLCPLFIGLITFLAAGMLSPTQAGESFCFIEVSVSLRPTPEPVIVDNSETMRVTKVGAWTVSTNTSGGGPWGTNYLHDGNTGKGSKSVTFQPNLPEAGAWEVLIWHNMSSNRATNVPVTISYDGGSVTRTVNQQVGGGRFNSLGIYNFAAGTAGSVMVSNAGTNGYAVADAVKFVWVGPTPPSIPASSDDMTMDNSGGDENAPTENDGSASRSTGIDGKSWTMYR